MTEKEKRQHVGKVRYSTVVNAKRALRQIINRTGRIWMHQYKCEVCNGYHIGHSNKEMF